MKLQKWDWVFLSRSPLAQQLVQNKKALFIGDGDPNVFSSTFAKIDWKEIGEYTKNDGIYANFCAELIVSYLYQFWSRKRARNYSK